MEFTLFSQKLKLLREQNITFNEKKSNSKSFDSVSFLRHSISKEGIALHPKHDEN